LLALARAAATAFAAVLTEADREISFFLADVATCFFGVSFATVRDWAAGRLAVVRGLAAGRGAALALGRLRVVAACAPFLATLEAFAGLRTATFRAAFDFPAAVLRTVLPAFPAGLLFRFVTTAAFLMLSFRNLDPVVRGW
jgi:hypothetical protein